MRAPPIGPVPDAGSWMLDPQPTRRRLVDLTWCTWRAHPPETLRCFAAQGDIQAALPRPARLHVILSELRPERPERAKDPLKPGRRRELIVAPEIGGDSSSPLPAPCFALRRDRSRLLRMTVADGCSTRIPRARQAPREVLKRIGVRVLTKSASERPTRNGALMAPASVVSGDVQTRPALKSSRAALAPIDTLLAVIPRSISDEGSGRGCEIAGALVPLPDSSSLTSFALRNDSAVGRFALRNDRLVGPWVTPCGTATVRRGATRHATGRTATGWRQHPWPR
jgi:hypothetical protein